jgi:drug/metabolite transporter (DMT)-like permease
MPVFGVSAEMLRAILPPLKKISAMSASDLMRLLALAAIWGGSYALMRVVAPVYGGAGTAWLRISIAGLALIAYAAVTSEDLQWRKFWKQYLLVGLMNSAIPFALIAYAMKTLPAGYGAIVNAMAPFFGTLFAALMLGEALTARRVSGLIVGFAGVATLVNLGPLDMDRTTMLAIGACLLATVSYGFISVYIKKHVKGAPNMGMAGGTLLLAAIAMTPVAAPTVSYVAPSLKVALCLLALALLCSGVAYLLYYRLIRDVGPTKAISVTFLVPLFGVLWGAIFFGERLTIGAAAGGVMILLGMALVLGLKLPRRAVSA